MTVLALAVGACGAPGGAPAADTPQFVEPTPVLGSPSAPASPTLSAQPAPPPSSAPASPSAKAKASSKAPTRVKYAFPVDASNVDYHPTHGKYPATDLFADCGEPVVATTSGEILEVSLSDRYVKGSPDGPNNGGLSVSLLGDDGVRYYGSHLSKVRSGIKAGVRVTAGQRLGDLGRTGNANNVCHLHYGISPPCAETGDWKVRRGVIWPAKFLDSWRNGGSKSPVAEVEAWERKNDCKA